MKFMIIVKATRESEAGEMPQQALFDAMASFHEKLAAAGVLRDANGLHPTAKAWRITWRNGDKQISHGPFEPAASQVAGYTLIEVTSRKEAEDWASRFPNPGVDGLNGEIEIRQLFELEDFEGVNVERFEKLDEEQRKG